MKIKNIIRILLIAVFSVVVTVFFSRKLLFPSAGQEHPPVNREHYVVPIKAKVLKTALKSIEGVSVSGTEITFPVSESKKLALETIRHDPERYGIKKIEESGDHTIISLTEGDGSCILVPVPMIIELIDRKIIVIEEKE